VSEDASIAWGREVVRRESEALGRLESHIGATFAETVRLLESTLARGGRILLTGSGKSGLVARKIAATFCSTGAPAIFLHPADAEHGDLGLVTKGDALIAISRSGNLESLSSIVGAAERLGVPVLAWTQAKASMLARSADVAIVFEVGPEADPDDVIPSVSSTTAMALGDAVAIALFRRRGLSSRDFATLHPGGQLGRRLTTRVRDLMRAGEDLPVVGPERTILESLHVISDKRLGLAVVVGEDGTLRGVLTDGDVRRALTDDAGSLSHPVRNHMTSDPRVIGPDELVERAIRVMEVPARRITALVVVDEAKRPIGVLHLHACLDAGFR
jgi:arabinose-5-phosphate isomerase